MNWNGENKGKFEICSQCLKKEKRSSEIFADENWKIFVGKGQIGEIFRGVWKFFSEIGGKCETEGNALLPESGVDINEEALYKSQEWKAIFYTFKTWGERNESSRRDLECLLHFILLLVKIIILVIIIDHSIKLISGAAAWTGFLR